MNPVGRRIAFAWMAACLSIVVSACSGPKSPDELFGETLSAIEEAAENRELGDFMAHISQGYSDSRGRSHEDIRRIAQIHLLRNRNLHVFRHITQYDVRENDTASIVVLVALAAQPIENAAALASIRAELMQFKVDFEFEDDWKVVSAEWSQARPGDFLN